MLRTRTLALSLGLVAACAMPPPDTDATAPDVSARDDAAGDASRADAVAPVDATTASDAGLDAVTALDAATDSATPGTDASTPAVQLLGRIDYRDPAGPRFGWSGAAIVARFTGTGVSVRLNDPGNFFRVAIDGAETMTLNPRSGVQTYPLATGLAAGTHTLEIWRRTEAWEGVTQFLGLSFPSGGALLPPPARASRRIEVIGDSITAGYGDNGTPGCAFTLGTENNYLDYGPVAARALNAEIHTVAWSGWGMYRGYDADAGVETVPSVYDLTMGSDRTGAWDFSTWIPDAVVINLGTNDWAAGDPGAGYTTAYVAFVRHLRTHYPHAYVLASIGPRSSPAARIMAAVNTLRAAGDTRVAFLQMGGSATDYAGCNGHPDSAAQAAMGAQLATALRGALGW